MSSYVFELTDVSIANGSDTLQINNSDSVFGAIPGSMLWIDSYRPRFVQSVDNTARTVTLTANWDGDSVVNKSATIVPLPSHEQQKQAVDSVNSVTDSARNLLDRFLGLEANYNQYLDEKYNGLKTLINGSIPFESVSDLTAYGEPVGQGHENNDVLAIVWNDTTPEYNGLYGWSGTAWERSTYDMMTDVVNNIEIKKQITSLRSEVLARGVGQGETGDDNVLAAFTTQALERTWLEVAPDTLGPSALAIARIVTPLLLNSDFNTSINSQISAVIATPLSTKADAAQVEAVEAELSKDIIESTVNLRAEMLARGAGQGETGDDNVLAAFTTQALERTWLEVAPDTLGPTDLSIVRIIKKLTEKQEFSDSVQEQIKADKLAGEFDDEEIDWCVAYESLERTWLEISKTGGPTGHAARKITESLDINSLTEQQVAELNRALSMTGGGTPDVVQVTTAPPPIPLQSALQGVGREYPTLVKHSSSPMFDPNEQTASSLFWPWLVDMSVDGISGSGYALFWSTDHSSTHSGSGTWMATSTSIDGPWTQRGMIFRDDLTGGEQHETSSIMWDEANNRWLHYYQLKWVPGYNNQLTMVASAPSLLDASGQPETWTVLGIAATENYLHNAGDGHSGYFKPYRYDGGWYAHGLYGGTNNSRRAFWISNDNGLTYHPNPEIMQSGQHLINHLDGFDTSTWIIKHNSGTQIERNGQMWMIAPVGSAASGGETIPVAKICAFRLSNDGITLGRAIDITPPLLPWEDQTLGVDSLGNTIAIGGDVYLVYRQGGGSGSFGLMKVL